MKISKLIRNVLFQSSTTKAPQYQSYRYLSTQHSKDLKLQLHQYEHITTKARVYHFQNQDTENAYASIIKTYSQNDKGCPHILEHLACCGSHKFPIRDPFFNMIKRSVNTYMNAWTGQDFTSYPFASANPKDWQNLYKVYLDMSLKPQLRQLDFLQEGWRFQLNDSGTRELKGIVFNEMKGAYQDAERQLVKQTGLLLFAGTPYIYDSGGNPSDIVNLEYSELKDMYEYYYHPSNMAFYFYGNNQLHNPLKYLATEYLNKYTDKSQRYNNINLKPKEITQKYKTIYSHTSESNNISINYYLGLLDSISPLELLCLKILNYIMLDKSNAQVYKKFIESEIAQNIGHSGFNQSKMATFTVTLKGIYPTYQCQSFENQFKEIITDIIKNGIDKDRVKQVLHQFEINILTPRQNNGIKILEECITQMNHRINLQSYLNLRHYLQQAAVSLADPSFLESFLNKFFLNNKYMVVVRQLLSEKAYKQEEITSQVVKSDEIIKQQQQQLETRQNESEDINVLPNLTIQDLIKPKRVQPMLIRKEEKNDKIVQHYQVKIKENVNHYRVVFGFSDVDASFLQKSALWIYAINRTISTGKYNYNQLTSLLAGHTSNFNVLSSIGSNEEYNLTFQFSCLKKNVNMAFSLLSEMVLAPKFQKQHTLNSFKSFSNEAIQQLTQRPFDQCLDEASSQLTKGGAILNSYKRIKESLKLVKQRRVQDLYNFSLQLHKCNKIKLIEHSNEEPIQLPQLITNLLKEKGQKMTSFLMDNPIYSKAITYNYMVNFCTKQFIAPKYMSIEHARVNLLLQLLQENYLHPLIREKGGAYGSGASIKNNGIISLYSYDDPNTVETFKAFQSSLTQLLNKDSIEDNLLFQAKLKQFGNVDRIKVPQNQGVNQILKEYTHEEYQIFRETLKGSDYRQIVEAGRKYLHNTTSSQCIFGKECPQGFSEQKLKQFLII